MNDYVSRKKQFDSMITLYGRQVALSLLVDPAVTIYRLHVADSNAPGGIMDDILATAKARGIEVVRHSRKALSRISRNGKQDQGVAVDVQTGRYRSVDEIGPGAGLEFIALDRVTNPQNLGMIIRSVAASPLHGLVLPRKGCAAIDPLVHKASAGTLLLADIFHCEMLADALAMLRERGFEVVALDGAGETPLSDLKTDGRTNRVFVLGNETDGISEEVHRCCDLLVSIPLNRGVESLNVASAATLVAFRSVLRDH